VSIAWFRHVVFSPAKTTAAAVLLSTSFFHLFYRDNPSVLAVGWARSTVSVRYFLRPTISFPSGGVLRVDAHSALGIFRLVKCNGWIIRSNGDALASASINVIARGREGGTDGWDVVTMLFP